MGRQPCFAVKSPGNIVHTRYRTAPVHLPYLLVETQPRGPVHIGLSRTKDRPPWRKNKKIAILVLNGGFRTEANLSIVIFFVALCPKGVLTRGLEGCNEVALQLPAEQRGRCLQTSLVDGEWLSHACVNPAYLLCITTANLPQERDSGVLR